MRKLLAVLALLFSLPANAGYWSLFTLEESTFTYRKFINEGFDPLTQPDPHAEQLLFNSRARLFDVFFIDFTPHATTTDSQFRAAGLEFKVGLRLSSSVDVSYYHHSQHTFDRNNPLPHFPVSDAVEIKFYLYTEKEREHTFLP